MPHRQRVKALCDPAVAVGLQRGAASDLISVLRGVADASKPARAARKHWHWPGEGLHIPELPEVAIRGLMEVT